VLGCTSRLQGGVRALACGQLAGNCPSALPVTQPPPARTCPEEKDDAHSTVTQNSFIGCLMEEVMRESDVVPLAVAVSEIVFRPIEPQDKEAVKSLHEEWFPVRSVAPCLGRCLQYTH
jgi:hypothetical protein